jgi:hypothetical protein
MRSFRKMVQGLVLVLLGRAILLWNDEEVSPAVIVVGIGWRLMASYSRDQEPLAAMLNSRPRKIFFSILYYSLIGTVYRSRSLSEKGSSQIGFGIGVILYQLVGE